MPRYVIVGGVAGGASAAARLRRLDEKADIILVERGDYISYANCGLPYYAGGTIQDRERLFVMTPERFTAWLNVEVRVATEALAIDRAAKTIRLKNLRSGAESLERYDALVLSPGAEPLRPPLPGIDLPGIFTLRSVPDVDRIKKWIDEKNPARAVVIGAGFIGLEMAENLRDRGVFVTIVEALNQVMAPLDFEMAALVHEHLTAKDVELYLGDSVASFARSGEVTRVNLASGAALDCDMVILSIGVRPDAGLAKAAGLSLTQRGAILVDAGMRTSDPHIWAVGDAVACPGFFSEAPVGIPLAGPANKQARIAADNIASAAARGASGTASTRYPGSLGTAIAKVFELTVAAVGMAEKNLERDGVPHKAVWIHSSSHAGYYPGARPLSVKTIFAPDSGRLLGAQIVGFDGVDSRINVMAAIMGMGGTVRDLAAFEHAYAPPYSSAKDPVNMAGFVAVNILDGLSRGIDWNGVEDFRAKGGTIIDVRTKEEYALGAIPGAINIPNAELRARVKEVRADRPVLVYCAVGLRGYLAERILRQSGFAEVYNLSGGYKTWQPATGEQSNRGIWEPGRRVDSCERCESEAAPVYAEGSGVPDRIPARGSFVEVDACGLQCPGPIMRLKQSVDEIEEGGRVLLSATDPGFARDVRAWARLTGNTLVSVEDKNGRISALVEKAAPKNPQACAAGGLENATIIVFSNDLDRALASFVLATGAASAGKKVTMFFTFWGLSVIKKDRLARRGLRVKKDFMGKMFGAMLPADAGKLGLSQMNFGGLGASMMRARMNAKNVDAIQTMIANARAQGIRFVACQMSMDMMGVAAEELLDGVEIGGVATYMEAAVGSNVNLLL